ncbi:MAG: DNA topoisomerase VI subunit B [Candidatus Thorarchaeota archaeon]|nr:MAG: DNA topoisomerase VI subunit B [Candidatus Thorarchaeota archaeon]
MLTPQNYNQDIVELSVSAWVYRNRAIAGFDNPARSLYVSVRELMENSLDACEDAQVLPNVTVLLKREEETSGTDMLSQGPETFELVVKDNGTGMSREAIPLLLGKMLTGTKFTHKQSRGTFGLGGSLALLYGQVTTQRPIEIVTGQKGVDHGYRVKMRLDIENNTPIIIEEEQIPKSEDEHGTMVSFWLQGDWIRSKRRILDYFAHTAIIVPYASLFFETPDDEIIKYNNVIKVIPKPSIESKPHPRGIDVEMLKSMIASTRKQTMKAFLTGSFQRVGGTIAEEFLAFVGIEPDRVPDSMEQEELVSLMNAMEKFNKFLPPSAKTLSPVGTDVLQAGVQRLAPEYVIFRQRAPSVYEGHPFIVETGVAYGGQLSPGVNVIRFANRIPLLYDEGSDVSYRVVRDLKLKSYGLRQEDPLTFMMHICSTKIPYKTIGKEYIADVDAVRKEIDLGFKDCLRELSKNLRNRNRATIHRKRESRLNGYYRFTAETLSAATGREVSIDRLLGSQGGSPQ